MPKPLRAFIVIFKGIPFWITILKIYTNQIIFFGSMPKKIPTVEQLIIYYLHRFLNLPSARGARTGSRPIPRLFLPLLGLGGGWGVVELIHSLTCTASNVSEC